MPAPTIEIAFRTDSSGRRFALWRYRNARALVWRSLGLREADAALKAGVLNNVRAVAEGADPAPEAA